MNAIFFPIGNNIAIAKSIKMAEKDYQAKEKNMMENVNIADIHRKVKQI